MRTLTAHVRHGGDSVSYDFVLQIQVPLLYVWPYSFGRNCCHTERELSLRLATSRVAGYIVPLRSVRQRRRILQRLGVALITVGVLEEDAVPAADCSLAISPWVIRKTDAGSGIEQVTFHAAHRNTGSHAALDNSVR